MNGTAARFLRSGMALSGLVVLAWVLTGHAAKPAKHGIPLPSDWSHQHLIFSRPGTAEQLARVSKDPRYWQQIQRREQALVMPASTVGDAAAPAPIKWHGKKLRRDWSEDLGAGASVGAGNYPAKFSFRGTTANCASDATPDFVVYSTGLFGSISQANIVAYDNLYSGCTGTKPSVYWAYNTSGQVLTSPVISQDGSQVAFVQTSGGLGTLVLIRWAAGTGVVGSPLVPTPETPANYVGCTAPCMTTVDLRDRLNVATDDTTSSVFYDYGNDIGWVGGAGGWLHKITGVFKGVPTEVHNAAFPVQVSTAAFPVHGSTAAPNTLSSPVYDGVSQKVFVGDFGGFLYWVNSTTAAITQSSQLDFGTGIVEGPIVDSANGFVYVFASSDGTVGNLLCNVGANACAAVYQLTTAFAVGDPGTEVTAGTSLASGFTPNPMYIGAFDDAYYTSGNATGNLYVCGNTGQSPALYQIPILAGVLPLTGSGTPMLALTSASFSPACSPVADVMNPNLAGGATERLFVSVQDHGVATGCGGTGCILNFVDTPYQKSTAYQLHQQILDTRLNIEEVIQAGTTGTTGAFSQTVGTIRIDGSVHWINQGPLSPTPLLTWTATITEVKGNRIVDSNGNIEAVTSSGGTTGGSTPTWNTTVGASTTDGTVTWINAGASLIATLPATGGTSGIIIDNVLNGALTGTSQVYFSTLSDQVCGTSGTGGCAVQASQPGLN
jgi:hypothetical protein